MKTFFLSIALLLSLASFSQVTDKMVAADQATVQSLMQSLLAAAPNYYILQGDSVSKKSITKYYSSGDHQLTAGFWVGADGTYHFSQLTGELADLLPIWKQHFDATATMEKVARDGFAPAQSFNLEGGKLIMSLKKEGALWKLNSRFYKK